MNNDKYLIMTNIDGFLFANYTTEKLLDYNEAWKELDKVRQADPNAKLVKVVGVIGHE
jgi:hypothetical protein